MKLNKKKHRFNYTLSLLCLCIALNIPVLNAQSTITVDTDYSAVSTPTAGTYNIQAVPANPPVASTDGRTMTINRFTNFAVAAGETVNILLNGVDTSINVVNSAAGANISGALNSRLGGAGSAIGGNMVFISPNGLVIGAAGQINAGSILLSTSGQSLVPLGPGLAATANLNNDIEDANIRAQGINASGVVRFTTYNSDLNINGNINSIDPSPIFQSTISPTFGNGFGIYLFSRAVNTSGASNITTNIPADIFIQTGNDIRMNLSNYTISPFAAVANRGEINIQGNVTTPSGYVNLTNDTTELINNIINITGTVNANAIFPGDRGGFVTLRNVVGNGSRVVIDGAAGAGNITAIGNTDGQGGSLSAVPVGSFQIINGGNVDLRNGPTGGSGGAIGIQSLVGGTTTIGGAFLNAATIGAITLADNAATGAFFIYDNAATPGIDVNNAINFPANSNVFLSASNGDVDLYNGVNPVVANGDITLRGEDITINGILRTTGSEITLLTRTGDINITAAGVLNSSVGSDIIISRTTNLGPLTVTSSGVIDSGGGVNDLLIGNTAANDFTRTAINLVGPTFGPYANNYNANTDIGVDTVAAPQLLVDDLNIVFTLPAPVPPPVPPAPPAPVPVNPVNPPAPNPEQPNNNRPPNNVLITETESVNSDLENTENRLETAKNAQQIIRSIDTKNPDTDNYSDITGFNFLETVTVCTVKEDSCEKFTDNSLGQEIVRVLLDGYPYVNEFAADNNGVIFSYDAKYHPQGLEGFLLKIKYLEDKMAKQGIKNNPLLGYKHPPAVERLEKVDEVIKIEHMDPVNMKVNKNKFNRIVGKRIK